MKKRISNFSHYFQKAVKENAPYIFESIFTIILWELLKLLFR